MNWRTWNGWIGHGSRWIERSSCALGLGLLVVLAGGAATAAEPAGPVPTRVHEVVALDPDALAIEPAGSGEVRVTYPEAIPAAPGTPDLPRTLVWIEIPAGMRAKGVVAKAGDLRDLGIARVAAAAADRRSDGVEWPASALPADLGTGAGAAWAVLGSQGSLRGHWVVGILVSPVRWEPASGRLTAASRVELELELTPATAAETAWVAPRARVVREVEEKFEAGAAKLVRGFQPATATESFGDAGTGPAGPGPYQPSFRPSADGSPVKYVIVTSLALAGEFQRLADWKTQKGMQAVVRTVESIDEMYPNGVDRAERIRFFIRDAYQNWGTLYVLLGGDTDVVPPRYAQMMTFGQERIPADYYFGCLDGNWNADGDARIAESLSGGPSDQCDLLFEVSIGRAPVSSVSQAETFVDKTLLYEKNPPAEARYPASILVLAERLFTSTHGADIAEEAMQRVPSWIRIERMYEQSVNYPGSVELTKEAATDSMNAGFGVVHHVGHGYRNSMSVGDGTWSNSDADAFTNAPRNSVVFAINCSSASIDFNSIGERFLKNPNGGAVGYIGTSRNALVSASIPYQNEWYSTVWQDSVRNLGLATDLSRAVLVPGALFDSPQRWNLMATTLLGDPEADLYTNGVAPLTVTHPASVPLGSAPISITVTSAGAPVAEASVTLWRAGEVFVQGETGALGTVELPNTANSTGNVTLTVDRTYHQPYQATIQVTAPGGAFAFIDAFVVDDDSNGLSSGDGDGQADAGETIELRVTLRNGGGAPATAVVGTLTVNDPQVTIQEGTVSYGTINAGGTAPGAGPYLVTVAPGAEVASQPVFTLSAASNQGTFADVAVMPIRRSYLEHFAHETDDAPPRGDGDGVVEAGEEIHYRVTLRNTGQDRAQAVAGVLHALHWPDLGPDPLVTMIDSLATFGPIAPGASATGDRFEFSLAPGADPSALRLELVLSDALGPVRTERLDVLTPTPSDSITAFGSPSSIRLEWRRAPESDVRGYDVYRAASPGGPFVRVNSFTVDGTSAYEDQNLSPLTRYYYQIATRDSSYNTSALSAIVSSTTNPPMASGWPGELGQNTASSVIVADIDLGPHMELTCGAEVMYAWHGDGTELVDGDSDSRTNGPLSLLGRSTQTPGFAATPAVGDLDGDDDLEIANVGFTRDSLFVWQKDGALFPGWPKWVRGDFNWASPLLADLDQDVNGDLEVVLWPANHGHLFAWHHDGVELVDGDQDPGTDGILVTIPGNSFNFGSPAVAQMDADPELEILVPINFSPGSIGAIYAYNIDGTPVPGWPFLTGGGGNNSEVSSSPAVGDLDQDGEEEIVIACERDQGSIYVLKRNGTVAPNWPRPAPARTSQSRIPSPVLADMNQDTFLDVIFPDTDGVLRVMDRHGIALPGFPVTYYPNPPAEGTQSTTAIGDIDGDGQFEIVFGDEAGRVHAYNHDGTLVAGFPIQTNGEVRGTPALWDVDRDNLLEVAVAGFDGNVYVWDLTAPFVIDRLPWPFFRHDTRNTGRVVTRVQQPTGIAEPVPAPGLSAAAFYPPRPNPFNPAATLRFDVPGEAEGARPVALAIYDASGRLVRQLVAGAVGTGPQSVVWDGRDHQGRAMGSGVYFARIAIGDFAATQKLTLIR